MGTLQSTEDIAREEVLLSSRIRWGNHTLTSIAVAGALRRELPSFNAETLLTIFGAVLGLLVLAIGGLTGLRTFTRRKNIPVIPIRRAETLQYSLTSSSLSAGHTDGEYEAEYENAPATVFLSQLLSHKANYKVHPHKTHVESWSIFAMPLLTLVLFALNLLLFETIWTTWDTARYTQASIFFPTGRGRFAPLMLMYDQVWKRGLVTFNVRIFLSVSGFLTAAFMWYISLSGILINFLSYFRILTFVLCCIAFILPTVLEHVIDNQGPSDGTTTTTRVILYVLEAAYLVLFASLLEVTKGLRRVYGASRYIPRAEGRDVLLTEDSGGPVGPKVDPEPAAVLVDWTRAKPATGNRNCIKRVEGVAVKQLTYAKTMRIMISGITAACMIICVVLYIMATVYKADLLRDEEIWTVDKNGTDVWRQPGTWLPRDPKRFYEIVWMDLDRNSILPIPGFPPEHTLVRFILIGVTYVTVVVTMFVPIRGLPYILLVCLFYLVILIPIWTLLLVWDIQLISTAMQSWCWTTRLNDTNDPEQLAILQQIELWATVKLYPRNQPETVDIFPSCVNIQYMGIAVMTGCMPLLLGLFVAVELHRKYDGGCRNHAVVKKYHVPGAESRFPHLGQLVAHVHNCVFAILECQYCKVKHYLCDNAGHILNCGGLGERTRVLVKEVSEAELVPLEVNVLVTASLLPRKPIAFATHDLDNLARMEYNIVQQVQADPYIKRTFPHLVVSGAWIINLTPATKQMILANNKRFSTQKYVHNERTAAIVTLVPPHNYQIGTEEINIVERQPQVSPCNICYHYWQPMGKHWFDWKSYKRICCDGILDTNHYRLAMDILRITDYKNPDCWKQPLERVLRAAFIKKQQQTVNLCHMAMAVKGEDHSPMYCYKGVQSHPADLGWNFSVVTLYRSIADRLDRDDGKKVLFATQTASMDVLDGLPILHELVVHTLHFEAKLATIWELLQLPAELTVLQYCTLLLITAYEYEQTAIGEHLHMIHIFMTDLKVIAQLRYLYDDFKEQLLSPGEVLQLQTRLHQILEGTAFKVRPMVPREDAPFSQVGYRLWGFYHLLLHIEMTDEQFLMFKRALPWGDFDSVIMYLFKSFASMPGFLQIYDLEKVLTACNIDTNMTRELWAELEPTEFGVPFSNFYEYVRVVQHGKYAKTTAQLHVLKAISNALCWLDPVLSHRFSNWEKFLEGIMAPALFYSSVATLIFDIFHDDDCSLSTWETPLKVFQLVVGVVVFIWVDLVGLVIFLGGNQLDHVIGWARKYVDKSNLPPQFSEMGRINRIDSVYEPTTGDALTTKGLEIQYLHIISNLEHYVGRGPITRAAAIFGTTNYRLPVTAHFHRDDPIIAGTIALIFLWELPSIAIALFELFVEMCGVDTEAVSFFLNLAAFIVSLISLIKSGGIANSKRIITTMASSRTQQAVGHNICSHLGDHVPPTYPEVLQEDKKGTPIMPQEYWEEQHFNLSVMNKPFDTMMETHGQIDLAKNIPIEAHNKYIQNVKDMFKHKTSPPEYWYGHYPKNGPTPQPLPPYRKISNPVYYVTRP